MRKVIAALMFTGLCLSPAIAQTTTPTTTPAGTVDSAAECQSNFKAADKDGNGTLSKEEMNAMMSKGIPTSVSNQDSVSMSQFMAACNAGRAKGG